METQLQRVVRMERIYDQCCEAVKALLEAAQAYRRLLPALRQLEAYYQSPQWMEDFDAEQAQVFPRDMKRGILTEDAIWDLLTDEVRMKMLLEQL